MACAERAIPRKNRAASLCVGVRGYVRSAWSDQTRQQRRCAAVVISRRSSVRWQSTTLPTSPIVRRLSAVRRLRHWSRRPLRARRNALSTRSAVGRQRQDVRASFNHLPSRDRRWSPRDSTGLSVASLPPRWRHVLTCRCVYRKLLTNSLSYSTCASNILDVWSPVVIGPFLQSERFRRGRQRGWTSVAIVRGWTLWAYSGALVYTSIFQCIKYGCSARTLSNKAW